jgi:hypothetical protein
MEEELGKCILSVEPTLYGLKKLHSTWLQGTVSGTLLDQWWEARVWLDQNERRVLVRKPRGTSYVRIIRFAKKKVRVYSDLENEFQRHRHSPDIFRADETGLTVLQSKFAFS